MEVGSRRCSSWRFEEAGDESAMGPTPGLALVWSAGRLNEELEQSGLKNGGCLTDRPSASLARRTLPPPPQASRTPPRHPSALFN